MTDDRRVPITLRMPRTLLDDLKEAADDRSHSMNAEIVQRLEGSLRELQVASVPESEGLSDQENAVIELWRAMNIQQRDALVSIAEQLVERIKTKKGAA